ncbi:MAG: transcription antitermination factor NusB [Candidatus Eisenbacteria bacterium]
MSPSRARAAAAAALVAVEEGAFLDRALRKGDRLAGADARERSFARRMVRGVLQMRGRIDWILERRLERRGPDRLDPWTRNILRIGIYQILYLSSVPSHAAVHETVRVARQRGGEPAARLVNGVLRRVLREGPPEGIPSIEEDPVRHLAIQESYPSWLVARWVARLGTERAADRLRAGNRTPPLALRVLDESRVEEVALAFEREGRKVRRSRLVPEVLLLPEGGVPTALAPFQEGAVIVQDEGAALASTFALPLDARARVLDICAAPGGSCSPSRGASPTGPWPSGSTGPSGGWGASGRTGTASASGT